MKRGVLAAVLLAAALTALSVGSAAARPQPFARDQGFEQRGRLARMAAPDEQQVIALAQGHQIDGFQIGYRVRRLLPIALVWLGSLGQPGAMPYAALAIAVGGNLLLAWALAELLPRRRWLAGLVVWLPPLIFTTNHLMPTTLGLGLAFWGWRTGNRWILLLAGFEHEVLLAFSLVRRRAYPIVAWASWAAVALVVWPQNSSSLFGLFSIFTTRPADSAGMHWALLGLTLAMGLLALRAERALALLYLAFACTIGYWGARFATDFTRLLAPLWVLGFLALAGSRLRLPSAAPRYAVGMAALGGE